MAGGIGGQGQGAVDAVGDGQFVSDGIVSDDTIGTGWGLHGRGRKGGREGGREGERGGREEEWEQGREGKREGEREGWREGRRDGRMEGQRERGREAKRGVGGRETVPVDSHSPPTPPALLSY